MKLNLVPPKDPEVVRIKKAVFILIILSFLCIGGVIGMVQYSTYTLQEVQDEYDRVYGEVENVKSIVHRTDRLWQGAEDLTTNLKLYHTIQNHNNRGIQLIEEVVRYVPSFFRVTSLQVYPHDKTSCQIQISGVLKTYQEYADLMISLMQMPKVKKAFRLPVALKTFSPQVGDQNQLSNQETMLLPLDPVERMAVQIALARPSLVNSLTGHKIGAPLPPLNERGSEVSVILVVDGTSYKVPDVRFTLSGVTPQSSNQSSNQASSQVFNKEKK